MEEKAAAPTKETADDKKKVDTAAVTEQEVKKNVIKGKRKGRPKRRLVQEGKVYIQATYNNTIVTITDAKGEVVAWSSSGANGFKGAKKATPYAAQVAADAAINKAKVFGLEKVHVIIKGVGAGREQAIRSVNNSGVNIESIADVTAVAHNGCRPRKSRRV